MRDPDLVHRAERAATALEEAWMRWRARHGLGTGPLPPVSSYVGYSVEEPWGQPRVVFGIEAGEAERLTAILDGQDYAGPVHAEVSAEPGRRPQIREPETAQPQTREPETLQPQARQPETAPAAWTVPANSAGLPAASPGVPAQAATRAHRVVPPAPADPLSAAWTRPAAPAAPARPAASAARAWSAPAPTVQVRPAQVPAVQVLPAQAPAVRVRPAQAPAVQAQGAASAVQERPAEGGAAAVDAAAVPESGQFAAAPALAGEHAGEVAAEELTAEQPILPRALLQAAAVADSPAELPADEAAYLQELAARPSARRGIVALQPRTAGPSEPEPQSAGHSRQTATDQPSAREPAESAGQAPPADATPARDDVQLARLLPVARLNRSRKPAEPGSWPAAGGSERASTDTAV